MDTSKLHERIGETDIAYVDPMKLKWRMGKRSGRSWFKMIVNKPRNFCSGNMFDYGTYKFNGWCISEGKVLEDAHIDPLYDKPKGTFIVYKSGEVEVEWKTYAQMDKIKEIIWFCCQGFNLYPFGMKIRQGLLAEGYSYNSVGYMTNRIAMGYNSKAKKVVIAARKGSNAERAVQTMTNLGCTNAAICLDSGGSTNLVVNKVAYYLSDRVLPGIIEW